MKKYSLLAAAVLFLSATQLKALDKQQFATHFKKSFSLDSKLDVTVGDPTPSQFAGLMEFPVTIGGQTQKVYLTKDEKFYFWGNVFDLSVDPDKERWSKISLKDVHSKGPKNAPVTIVEYSDIQCPNCQKAHEMVDSQLFKDFPTQVRLVFKHFPLSMHEWAEPAAVSAECASRESNEAFWKMTDMLFTKGEKDINLTNIREKSLEYAKGFKFNMDKYKACLDDPTILEKIKSDKQEGAAAGVNATPSFFINGRLVRGNRYEDVKSVVNEKLAELKNKK